MRARADIETVDLNTAAPDWPFGTQNGEITMIELIKALKKHPGVSLQRFVLNIVLQTHTHTHTNAHTGVSLVGSSCGYQRGQS